MPHETRRGSDAPPEEPLELSAPVARDLARRLCVRTGDHSCDWYHGLWQYLRLMGLGKTMGGQSAFFLKSLRELAQGGGYARVLVSGTADYSSIAHVLSAFRRAGAVPRPTVVDRCETPLELSRWYAGREGSDVATAQFDILDYRQPGAFDIVLTNSFLGYFDHEQRERLFANFRELLRPGGKLMFTNRLRPGAGGAPVGFGINEAARFLATIDSALARHAGGWGADPAELKRWATLYSRRFRSYAIESADQVGDYLIRHGFATDLLDAGAAARAGTSPVATGPTVADGSAYLRVIATRR
jgi:SAM-dependent methyltransferase